MSLPPVPVGGGSGKIVRIGRLPANLSLQAYDNIEKPKYGPDWSPRFRVWSLLPK